METTKTNAKNHKHMKKGHSDGKYGLGNMKIVLFVGIIIFLIIMSSSIIMAQTYNSPELSVSFLNQDPNPAEPGNFFTARFKVENIGLGEATDVQLEILPEYPFSIYQDSAIKQIASISPRQKGSEAFFMEYKLRADENAIPGNHTIRIRYRIDNGPWVEEMPGFSINIKQHDVVVALGKVSTAPEVVKPGEKVKLSLEFQNIANTPVKYLTVKLGLVSVITTASTVTVTELPFSPVSSTNEIIFPLIRSRETVSADFNLIVDPDAKSKVYKIPVTYTYTDPSNTNYSKQSYVSVIVGDMPQLAVNVESSSANVAGIKGEVIVKFVNKGLNDIKFLYARLKPGQNYELLSASDVYVGNIDSDDYETVSYQIYIKENIKDKITLPLTVEYKDVNNNDYSQEISLEAKIYSNEEAKKLGLQKSKNVMVYVIIAVVVIAAFVFYRQRRKNKNK